jgi:hypothetical protein
LCDADNWVVNVKKCRLTNDFKKMKKLQAIKILMFILKKKLLSNLYIFLFFFIFILVNLLVQETSVSGVKHHP